MSSIYELIEQYKKRPDPADRAVAAVMDNLNDRRGIKQVLQGLDEDVLEELFESLGEDIENAMM